MRKISGSTAGTALKCLAASAALAVTFSAATAHASVWTDWTSTTTSHMGAIGTLGGVGVTYSGEVDALHTGPNATVQWSPDASWIGGLSTSSPSTPGDSIQLDGNAGTTNTITFASPILNPLFAVWSLGQAQTGASFDFQNLTPILQAGGASSQYGGSSIFISSNSIVGNEGNGVASFAGLVSSISWTNTPENFYAFTVGLAGRTPVSEPVTLGLFGFGLAGLSLAARRRKTA